MTEPAFATAAELLGAFRARTASPVEVVDAQLERIERLDGQLRAFITVAVEEARASAAAAERAYATGEETPPLLGIPVAIKDTEFTAGLRTTEGSRIHEQQVPDRDSIVVQRLRSAGAIVLGKTNTPEFGMGGETESEVRGRTANPWDPGRTSGGSSGGSAAAVAAGLTCLASGTDAAGSVNTPAAFCGVVGMKPTHGAVPYWPMRNPWPSFLDAGPIARSVSDAALMLRVIAGADARDPRSADVPLAGGKESVPEGLAGIRAAWTATMGYGVVSEEAGHSALALARQLEPLGVELEEDHPSVEYPFEIWPTIARVEEYAAFGSLLESHRDRLTSDVRERLEAGRSVPRAEYERQQREMLRFQATMDAFLDRYDVLLTPTNAVGAFPAGSPPTRVSGREVPGSWEGFAPFPICVNLSGQPAATVPCGRDEDGLPLGLMVTAQRGRDELVLNVAAALEAARPWPRGAPDLLAD